VCKPFPSQRAHVTDICSFLYFYAYTFLRNLVLRRAARSSTRKPVVSVSKELLLGFIAGVSSRLATAPLSIVTVRLQTDLEEEEDSEKGKRRSQALTAIKSIYAEDGLLGFWKGRSNRSYGCRKQFNNVQDLRPLFCCRSILLSRLLSFTSSAG
jgi:hypothetical protein